jgi:subtilisin
MKRFTIALVLATAFAGTIGTRQILGQGASRGYIVVFHDDERDTPRLASEHARAYGASLSHVYQSALKGYAARIPDARIDDIRRDPRVAFVSEDRPVHAVLDQSVPTGINRIDAAPTSSSQSFQSSNVAVAVIDTGSGPHPDLNIDAAVGVNCSTGTSHDDGNGHGTHVAGTIGAKNNGLGVVGVAPGIPIYSVRVLDNAGSGSWISVACGIDWVTAKAQELKQDGIKLVANMSLGGSGSDDGNCGNSNNDALHKAICRSVEAGVTYVVAAGNDNRNLSGFVPAAYNEVLAVTAVADFNGQPGGKAPATCRRDVDDTSADFSNYATPGSVDANHTIAAPGVCIESTWKGGGYNTISGTSMASPHVAGTAALCIATANCSGTPAEVIGKLRTDASHQSFEDGFTGDPNHPIKNRYFGYLVYAGGY